MADVVRAAGGLFIADEVQPGFGRKIRYFNTFRGNSVCVAAAAAVLDVIESEGLRERRVLISATGPDGASLKIRPPLPFSPANVDQLADALTDALRTL